MLFPAARAARDACVDVQCHDRECAVGRERGQFQGREGPRLVVCKVYLVSDVDDKKVVVVAVVEETLDDLELNHR